MRNFMKEEKGQEALGAVLLIGFIFVLFVAVFAVFPQYNVYKQELSGKADLKEAEWNKQVQIEDAKGMREASVLIAETKIELAGAANKEAVIKAAGYAEAEVIRARGVAEANEIIGESLKDNDAYLRYLWINGLHDGSSEVIYIPTEANLPLLEARDNRMGE